ncbi:hypothetical protein C7405_108109 [Paraburkholderia caballeronis]|nr:hypothetical protein C7405_108109 [Paraburkholderia caballeronis]
MNPPASLAVPHAEWGACPARAGIQPASGDTIEAEIAVP